MSFLLIAGIGMLNITNHAGTLTVDQYSGGDIDQVIDNVASLVPSTHNVVRLSNASDVLTTCRSSLNGVTQCYASVFPFILVT